MIHAMDQPPPIQPYAPPIKPSMLQCINCGYDLSGTAIGGRCPECGTDVVQSVRGGGAGAALPTSSSATACMICGILSLAVCQLIGIAAIVLYFVAMNDVKSGKSGGSSRGFAIAGLVTGIISTTITLAFLIIYAMMAGF